MAKDKVLDRIIDSNEKTLKREKYVYDGISCQLKTHYKKGTKLSEIKPEHKKLIVEKDIK